MNFALLLNKCHFLLFKSSRTGIQIHAHPQGSLPTIVLETRSIGQNNDAGLDVTSATHPAHALEIPVHQHQTEN